VWGERKGWIGGVNVTGKAAEVVVERAAVGNVDGPVFADDKKRANSQARNGQFDGRLVAGVGRRNLASAAVGLSETGSVERGILGARH